MMALFRKMRVEEEDHTIAVSKVQIKKEATVSMDKNVQTGGVRGALGVKKESVGTVLGESCSIEGKVVCGGTLRIDGKFEGEIVARETLIIGPSARVSADLTAKSIIVNGKVNGNIHGEERVEVQASGEVVGNIETLPGSLIVESGAKIDGKCMMIQPEKKIEPIKPKLEEKPLLSSKVPGK